MTNIGEYYTALAEVVPDNKLIKFMLTHGRVWAVNERTFEGPRAEQGACFRNASLLAFEDNSMTYVEGIVMVSGVAIEHAWCVDPGGFVVDPTLDTEIEIGPFFGVQFRTDYVRKATIINGTYSLLDFYYSRETLMKLIELGLDEGQEWLLNGRLKV